MVEKKRDQAEPSEGVAVVSAENNDFLLQDPEPFYENAVYLAGDVLNGKWMKLLLTEEERLVMEHALHLNEVHRFGEIATVEVGIVTGANKYFLVNDATVNQYGLHEYVHPMFGRSEHCPFYQYVRHQALVTAFQSHEIIYSVNQLGDKYGIDEEGIGFAPGGTAGEVSISHPKVGYSLEVWDLTGRT